MGKRHLSFLWFDEFAKDWEALGLSLETDLWDLELAIMEDPEAGTVVRGACGLRKLRFAPKGWNIGKSGAVRVGYAYLKSVGFVLMAMAYGKSVKVTLSAADKRAVCAAITRIEKVVRNRR